MTGKKKTKKRNFKKEHEDMRDKMVKEIIVKMLYIPLIVMHDKAGYGKVRLERLAKHMLEYLLLVQDGYLSIQDMVDWIDEYAGYKILTTSEERIKK